MVGKRTSLPRSRPAVRSEPNRATAGRWAILIGFSLVTAVAAAAALSWLIGPGDEADQIIQTGRMAYEEGDYPAAEALATRVLKSDPNRWDAWLLAAHAVAAQGRYDEALRLFERIPDNGESIAVQARCAAGDLLLLELKQISAAERQFRRALKQDPDSVVANDHLAYALGLSTRNWEQVPFRLAVIRLQKFNAVHLYLLALGETAFENPELAAEHHQAAPDDPAPLLALARFAREEQQYDRAESLLRDALAKDPQLIEGHVELGRLLAEHGAEGEFAAWARKAPKAARQHPGYWVAQGVWRQRLGDKPTAARCFWEAVRLDPNRAQANYQLGRLLSDLEGADEAKPFLQRAEDLQQYVNAVKAAQTNQKPELAKAAAEKAESLGLLWEAYGWATLTLASHPEARWAAEMTSELVARLPRRPTERAVAAANPAAAIDLSNYPLPHHGRKDAEQDASELAAAHSANPEQSLSTVAFRDAAEEAGLAFSYFNGGDPQKGIARMYEFTGGGAAVLDYDCDGWPDAYLTQGARWPAPTGQREHLDRLFRNRGDGQFAEVSGAAGLVEDGFSQGAAVGDFDNDGFPDLLVGNIGRNRLFRNNGDGTFSDATGAIPSDAGVWTTSCLLADVNGDSLPDVYTVNYLTGEDVFTRVCRDATGAGLCMPQHFPAEQDQLFLNLGDGRFEEVTREAGVALSDGKGLGIVAGDFAGDGRLSLFIANDSTPNFYLVNQAGSGERPEFADQALIAGLGLNEDGRSEACMGVAAGDADGDGRLDVFVTNFADESNTLYLNSDRYSFLDATRAAGLREPSLPMLGFGTQFLDADLDGRLDLIVANGHIDDFRPQGGGYQMPPQFFYNLGDGRFAEAPAATLGSYFQGRYLGRGLARWDWNRDGREDVIVSHLDAPAALLTNVSAPAGRSLAIQLRGVASSRDAVGAIVRAKVGNDMLVRQLTAGDGYHASNQRTLVLGLGDRSRIDELTIQWPSGQIDSLGELAAGREYLLIEGRPTPAGMREFANDRVVRSLRE